MNFWTSLAIGAGSLVAIFTIAWLVARGLKFYPLVDAVWAFSIGLIGILWLTVGSASVEKRLVAGILVAAWSLRLGFHLQQRLSRAFPEEDPRYAILRDTFQKHELMAWFGFFQIQALSAALLALPFLLVAFDPGSGWSIWETIGTAVVIAGITGESLADRQMKHFKIHNNDRKAVCKEGLWKYSRHPNYFFEGVIWIGFYVYACGSAHGWATFHAPAIMIFLLLRVTGIPPTEAASVASKGDAYREYQRTTSPFIPLPPKTT